MNWIARNKNKIIRSSFLIPILLVVIISISHVVSWYEIGNPINWAIYLSIAIEIFALTSVSAATININKGTIWFLFILVTLIQLIGNVFFSFNHIDETGQVFNTWVELIGPLFEDWDALDHKRFLALIQGGTLPIMSLTALHFYLKFNEDEKNKNKVVSEQTPEPIIEEEEEEGIEFEEVKEEEEEEGHRLVSKEPKEMGDVATVVVDTTPPIVKEPKVEEVEETEDVKEQRIKRENIKEVKLRDNNNGITRVGTNKYQDGNNTGNIVYDGGKKKNGNR